MFRYETPSPPAAHIHTAEGIYNTYVTRASRYASLYIANISDKLLRELLSNATRTETTTTLMIVAVIGSIGVLLTKKIKHVQRHNTRARA